MIGKRRKGVMDFWREFGEEIGTRYVCLDLDMVIVRDITTMFDIPQSFAMMKGLLGFAIR